MLGIHLVVLFAAAGPAFAESRSNFRFFEPVSPPRPVQAMAHRGLHALAPENTKPALDACALDYVEWAEVDVRVSKDGKHVLCHDERLERTTNGKGLASDFTLAELQKLDAGAWFAPRFAGARMPSLADTLAQCKGRLNLYLDCKRVDPDKLAAEILAAGMESQVIVFAKPDVLRRVGAAANGKLALMMKINPSAPDESTLAELQPAAVESDADQIDAALCRRFHDRGIKVQAKVLGEWDRAEVWMKCIAAGVDWLQTDYPVAVAATALRERMPKWPVGVACHRGGNRYAPENTVASIQEAVRLTADFAEVDIRPTKDGRYLLLHDDRLDRTTTGRGKIRDWTFAEASLFDAGIKFGTPFTGTRIPTLDEGLTALGDRCGVYLDAKDIEPAALAAAIRKYNLLERSVVYQGIDYLKKLRAIEPAVRTLPPLKSAGDLEKVAATHPYGVDASWRILSKDLIERCHTKGIRVFSDSLGWFESVEQYRKAMEWGIDVIQTDHPARVLRAIELFSNARQEH
jgi:glycerophosphoryl diester phosphodiesterase